MQTITATGLRVPAASILAAAPCHRPARSLKPFVLLPQPRRLSRSLVRQLQLGHRPRAGGSGGGGGNPPTQLNSGGGGSSSGSRNGGDHLAATTAASEASGPGASAPPASGLLVQLVASPLYRNWLQLGVVLLLAMLVDAGFSGDWSRIGAITQEQEAALRQVAVAVGAFHLACGAAAAAISARRGERWAPRTAKVLAVGLLALVEVALLPERDAQAAADDGRG